MSDSRHVLEFYSRHPISRDQILAQLGVRRGHLERLAPEDLFAYDQDHYGGLSVVLAMFFLKERVTKGQWFGIGLTVAGLAALSWQG